MSLLPLILLAVGQTCAATSIPTVPGRIARSDYVYTKVGAHKLHPEGLNWNEARRACNAEGGSLAVIDSVEEAELLANMLKGIQNMPGYVGYKDLAWMGYHDYFRSREWATIAGKSAESGYMKWKAGEPDKYKDKHCLHWDVTSKIIGFSVGTCSKIHCFFCELPTYAQPAAQAVDSRRPDYTYTALGAHKLHGEGRNWNDARKICNDEGADFAIINSAAEAELLSTMLRNIESSVVYEGYKDLAWMGFHDYFSSREWVTIKSKNIDGNAYVKWKHGEPAGYKDKHCVHWDVYTADAGYSVGTCNKLHAFFCELPAVSRRNEEISYRRLDGETDERVDDETTNRETSGERDEGVIGERSSSEGRSDVGPNRETREVVDDRPDETTDDQAGDSKTESTRRPICLPGYNPYALYRDQPRDDYAYTALGAHKFHPTALTWNDARKFCRNEGAELAIIDNALEAKMLKKMFLANENSIFATAEKNLTWLGYHDFYKSGDWVTIFSTPLASTGYTVWSSDFGGQPNRATGNDHCVALDKLDGGFNDYDCDRALPFICEQPMLPSSCS